MSGIEVIATDEHGIDLELDLDPEAGSFRVGLNKGAPFECLEADLDREQALELWRKLSRALFRPGERVTEPAESGGA